MATAGYNGRVRIGGTPVAVTSEACSTSDNTVYTITDTARRIMEATTSVTVDDGGTPTVESYTLDRLAGTITFGSATARTITLDYSYVPTSVVGEFNSSTISISATNEDTTIFGDSYVGRTQAILDVTGSLGGFWTTDTTWQTELLTDQITIVEIHPNNSDTTHYLRCWAKLASIGQDTSPDAMTGESIEFEGVNDSDGRAASVINY